MSTDFPSSSTDYALRRDLMLEWATDLGQLTVLREELTTARAELERKHCENIAMNTTINMLRFDNEALKEKIATQEDNADRETHQRLLDNYNNLQAELDETKIELNRQLTAFAELQRQKNEEQSAYINRLREGILSTLSEAPASPGQSNPEPTPAVSGRLQASADIPQMASTSSITTQPQPENITRPLPHGASNSNSMTTIDAIRPRPESASDERRPIKNEDEDEDDITMVDFSGFKPSKYLTPLPEGRRKELEAFPEFVPDIDESAVFNRGFLAVTLGGSFQPLIVRIGKQTQTSLAQSCNIEKFLCPNQNQNPWCPRLPGEHGYIFMGLGSERETFREPEQLNLFLSVPVGGNRPHNVTYMGFYEVARVAALTVDEWRTLSPTVRNNYVATMANRRDEDSPVVSIRAEYDSGVRLVPCVRLRCIGFDEALYTGLLAVNDTSESNNKRRSEDGGPDPKRPRRGENMA